MSAQSQTNVEESDRNENLWTTILNDVAQSSARCRMPSGKTLLVLGEVSSGKSVLVDKICQASKTKNLVPGHHLSGCCLEYRYFDVRDEETDDWISRMGIWILDGVVYHSDLLKFALKKDDVDNTLVMIVVDLSKPWSIMESLERWVDVVQRHVNSLDIPPEDMRSMEAQLVERFRQYVDPEEQSHTDGTTEGSHVSLPLDDSVLSHNLGLPLIVVGTKSDAFPHLEKEHGYKEEHYDFIQQNIRKFCLKYGAALFYVSSVEERNCDVLHKYIVHQAYGQPFTNPASVVEKDAIFIPSGWDSEKKIAILKEHMKDVAPDSSYHEVIKAKQSTASVTETKELVADDDQIFLQTTQIILNKTPSKSQPAPKPTSQDSSPKPKQEHAPQGEGKEKEAVLANFFNSLLAKGKTGSSKATKEATAQIDKLQAKTEGRLQK